MVGFMLQYCAVAPPEGLVWSGRDGELFPVIRGYHA